MKQFLFVAGVPASGKSYFGRWLEAHHGFVHIDPEENDKLDTLGLHEAWDRALVSRDFAAFTRKAGALERPVLFNWGFPVHCLFAVKGLREAGFSSWWFSAPIDRAREAFQEQERGSKSLESFERQVVAIEANLAEIHTVFSPNILETLSSTGQRMSPEQVWAHISGAA